MTNKLTKTLDTCGTCCPMPLVNSNKAMKDLKSGEILEVIANDPATCDDIPAWCKRTGNDLLESDTVDGRYRYLIKKA